MPEILPKILSDLLEIAIDDGEKAEKTKGVKLDMGKWLDNNPQSKSCTACMAGIVMMRRRLVTVKIPDYFRSFYTFECDGNRDQLDAIDSMRACRFQEAAIYLGITFTEKQAAALKKYPEVQDRLSWPEYRKIVKHLRRLGL